MNVGKRHPDAAPFWFAVERPYVGRGRNVWLRIGQLQLSGDAIAASWREWEASFLIGWRFHDLLRVYVGPGVIPF